MAMSEKVSFGADFIDVLSEMNVRCKGGFDPRIHACRGIFLLDWGLTLTEIDEATVLFSNRFGDGSLVDMSICLERILVYIGGVKELQEKLFIQMVTLALLDDDVSDDERILLNLLSKLLDFRPSEVNLLFNKAVDLKVALRGFAEAWLEKHHATRPADPVPQ
jgi:hypothetical protein